MRRRSFALLAVLLSLAFAPSPFPKTPRSAADRAIQGSWANKNDASFRLAVTSISLTYQNGNGAPAVPYELTFDATTSPKSYALGSMGRAAFIGIYRIEGNVLTLFYRPAHRPRPTSFEEGDAFREVYVRVRD